MFAVSLRPPGSSRTMSNRRKIVEQSRTCCATQKPDCLAIPSRISSDAGFGGSALPAACARTEWNENALCLQRTTMCCNLKNVQETLYFILSKAEEETKKRMWKTETKKLSVTYAPLLNSHNSSLLATRIE
jgi:hypothetical protein